MAWIPFTKMEGTGNDFILVDNRQGIVPDARKVDAARAWCPRAVGVGADGVIFLENDPEYDFRWDFYNADGSAAEMCGNGSRCVARFAHALGAAGTEMTFRTLAGPIHAAVTDAGARVRLTDAAPPQAFPGLAAAGRTFDAWLVNTGVPHAVVPVDDLDGADVDGWGRALRFHEAFAPKGANVNFIVRAPGGGLAIRTYERGVEGETLACGTGSVASAMVAGELWGLPSPVKVSVKSGQILGVAYRRAGDVLTDVDLEGPARVAFEGRVGF